MALQKPFPGLRKFLGFLESGALPVDWANGVFGTLDMLTFLSQEAIQVQSAIFTVSAIGYTNAFTVPDNEMRLITYAGLYAAPGAGEQIDFYPAVNFRESGSPSTVGWALKENVDFRGGNRVENLSRGGPAFIGRPFFIGRPGDGFGFQTQSFNAAGSITCGSAYKWHTVNL